MMSARDAVRTYADVFGSIRIRRRSIRGLSVGLVVLLVAACGTTDVEEDVAAFYEGKTVTIMVGTPPGGGFDDYARLVASRLGDHIPGNPTVVVENRPGAAHLVAMNHIYNSAPSDGTIIGNVRGGLVMDQLFGADGVEYDMREVDYLGMPDPPGNFVLVVRTVAGVQDFSELLGGTDVELVVGATAPASPQTATATAARNVLDANLRIIDGYGGTGPMVLAMEQGEIDAFVATWDTISAARGEKFDGGEWDVILSFAEERADDLPDVPTVFEFASNERQHDLLYYAGGPPQAHLRIYLLPPGVPTERVEALRDAFAATLEDDVLLERAEEANLTIGLVPGEDLGALFKDVLSLPSDLVDELEQALLIE